MSNLDNREFSFGPRFVITIVFAIGAWMLWQSYMVKQYPDYYKAKTSVANVEKIATQTNSEAKKMVSAEISTADGLKSTEIVAEKLIPYEDETWRMDISTKGFSLRNVQLKKYTDRAQMPIAFADLQNTSLFSTSIQGKVAALDFDIKQTSENEFFGTTFVDGLKISKRIVFEPAKYLIQSYVDVENVNDQFSGLVVTFSDKIATDTKSSFIMPSFNHQEFYIDHEGTYSRIHVDPEQNHSESFKQTNAAGFGSQYFAVAIIDRSQIVPEFSASVIDAKSQPPRPIGVGTMMYTNLKQSKSLKVQYSAFVGPKSYELLKSIDANFTHFINFGFFTAIAKGIYWLMTWIYGLIGNWGVAIIFLTIIVRIIVLPFNLIGYKQMKAMTKIQPQIKLLREKYKNDGQKLNQEMLSLMKEAKANPLGGCLPMLVQIPVFFALYQVIGQSIELYQAPFMLWIHDLSLKDPFFVLPILMGVTMFVQQKITPSTLEPAQQKIMNVLPIVFSLLMVTLPSGLTLYIFISSVFGVIQQFYFTRDNYAKP